MSSEAGPAPPLLAVSLYRRIGFWAGLLLFVLLLLWPIPGMADAARRMAAVTLLMAAWWITEAIPIPATSLLPLVLFPLLGITDAKSGAAPYADFLIFLFLGGFFIALGVQKWQLHRRVALLTISLLGFSLPRLVLGFMVATAFISLWVSNTATAVIMLPVGMAILQHLKDAGVFKEKERLSANFGSALMFGIAYSASIGGIGTLIGTPPNIILAGVAERTYDHPISFTAWLGIGLPVVILYLPITWFYLTRLACPIWHEKSLAGGQVISEELGKIGKMTPQEIRVAIIFLLTALAWIFSEPKDFGAFYIPGLKTVFPNIADSSIAIAGALALFVLPAKGISGPRLLDWTAAKDIPWGILLLFGGGLALAEGFKQTGLDLWIGQSLAHLSGCPHLVIVLMVTTLVIFLTEVTSNTATTAMILPVCGSLALAIGGDPLLLMVPATIAASCGFMLPVGTPPNALIFASGCVTIPQMARIGLLMDLIGIVLITVVVYVFAVPVLGLKP